jgi:hypothetical protein
MLSHSRAACGRRLRVHLGVGGGQPRSRPDRPGPAVQDLRLGSRLDPVMSQQLDQSARPVASYAGQRLAVIGGRGDTERNILMHGYGPVAKTLVRHGLLDELFLWVHPMLAGVGTVSDMLISEGLNKRLTLLGAKTLNSGVVILSYEPARPAGSVGPDLSRARASYR